MRVYERNEVNQFRHPEDMKLILDYLNSHGKILVSNATIERLYGNFSEECCAGWLCVNEYTLEEFEEWLNNVEL